MNLPTDFCKRKHGFSKSIVIAYKSLQISKRLFVSTKLKSYHVLFISTVSRLRE